MTDVLDDPFTQPIDAVRLDGRGRYDAPCPATGRDCKHTRVTTFVKALADNIALERWNIRETVEGLVIDETLYLAACAAMQTFQRARAAGDVDGIQDGKEALDTVAYRARERAGALEGATRGTAHHSFTETLDVEGCAHFVPSWVRPKLDNYQEALERAGLQVLPEYVERRVHSSLFETIGTLDRLYFDERTGMYVVGDVKSARQIWTGAEWSIQLGVYANSEHIWNTHTQTWDDMPAPIDRSKAVIVWMPHVHPEGNDVVTIEEIKIDRAYQHAARLCAEARAWRNEGKTLLSRRP